MDEQNEPEIVSNVKDGGKKDLGAIVGLTLGFGSVIAGMYIEGSSVGSYMVLSAAVIVFGGTVGATIASTGLEKFKTAPASFQRAVNYRPMDRVSAIRTLVAYAEKARRYLAFLESRPKISNPPGTPAP